jgi:hypothetical protein
LDLLDFFEFLYQSARPDGCLTAWAKQTKTSRHFPGADGFAEAAAYIQTLVNVQMDAYYGVGLRRPGLQSHQRGGKADVSLLPGFYLDVDIADVIGAHAASNLPTTVEAACAIVEMCVFEPTMLVHSGHGLHAYWLFTRPLVITPAEAAKINAASRTFQAAIIDRAKAQGSHVDQTGNIDRVLRPPGTMNFKIKDAPRPASVLLSDGPRYDLRALVTPAQRTISIPAPGPATPPAPPEPIDPDKLLADMRIRLSRLSNQDNRVLMAKVLAGEAFAVVERDNALQKVASIVAFAAPTGADPEILVELLEPSLAAVIALGNDPANPAPTREVAIDKLRRALGDAAARRAADEEQRQKFVGGIAASQVPQPSAAPDGSVVPTGSPPGDEDSRPQGGTSPPGDYTEDDVRRFALSQDCSTPEEFARRWLIQIATAFYVFVGGAYQYPVPKEALLTRLRDDFAPAEKLGLSLWTFNKDGSTRKKNVQEVMDSYGTVARQVKGSLTLPMSRFDAPTATFWESVCPLREIQPVYHDQIDRWLRLLGGEEAERLLDWLATAMRLERQSSALYLSGKAGAGKTLLANGTSRLWTRGGPTELVDVVGTSFNAGIAKCPLIFGDEDMDCSTTDLRRLIGSSAHTLRRKYLPNVELDGALRVILADNGGRMLIRDEEIGGDDLEAVASKFLHITVSDAPVAYLKSIGGREGTEGWVSDDLIAQHITWLAANREVVSGDRFIVPGHVGSMARMLAVQGKVPGLVCEWVAGFLDKPIPNPVQQGTILVGGGSILINADAIVTHWGSFIQSDKQPFSRTRVGTALGNLSNGYRRVGTRRYHNVRPELIFAWAEANLIGDLDTMRARVRAPLSPEVAAVVAASEVAAKTGTEPPDE